MYSPPMMTRTIKNYYNKGYGDIKKAKHKNLLADLSENPASLMYLDKYKKARNAQNIFSVVGIVSAVRGVALLIYDTNKQTVNQPTPNLSYSLATIGAGVVSSWVGFFISLSKPKHLKSAIDEYNK